MVVQMYQLYREFQFDICGHPLICRDLNSSRESIATEIKASACEIPDSGWRRTRRLGVGDHPSTVKSTFTEDL
jgi:hypothetical protein